MISPQGYKLGAAPTSENPFWGEGEDSDVNKIFATATVDEGTGVPSVTTTKQISGNDITFGFKFHNLKGGRGDKGSQGDKGDDGFSPSANVEQLADDEAVIYVTDKSGTTVATIKAPKGTDGFSPEITMTPIPEGYHMKITDATGTQEITIADGKDGTTPVVSATATISDTTGIPNVVVTNIGTETAPIFQFAFSNIKGETGQGTKGDDGFSPSASVQQTDTGATITITDKSGTTTANVENGTNGTPGPTGPAPSITATATVDDATGTPSVEVTKSGTDEAPVFNFDFSNIKGADGQSITGPGVAAGGTAGQVLTKKSGTDYDTEWQDPAGGSVSVGDSIKGYCEYESFDTFTANQRRIVTLHTGRSYSILTGKKIVHAALVWSYSLGTTQFPIQLNVLDWFEENGKLAFTVEAYNTASSNKSISPNTVRYFIQLIDE